MATARNKGVLVIGTGGIGCPALLHLASSGVPVIGMADYDVVQVSNLHRQLLFTEQDLGLRKVERAAAALGRLPGAASVRFFTHDLMVKGDEDFLGRYEIVIEAIDRADSKLALHDALVRRGITLIHTGASGWEAQGLTVRGPGCLRCLFDTANFMETADCQRDGILGPVAGLAGLLAADEALRLLSGRPGRWERNLWTFHARSARARFQSFKADSSCPVCGAHR